MRQPYAALSACAALLLLPGAARAVTMDTPQEQAAPKGAKAPALKPGDIAALIANLGAPTWQVREKAMRDLIAAGDAARTPLRQAATSRDPEVRWRATHALSLLDTQLVAIAPDAAKTLYASAARARAQADSPQAARQLYQAVIEQFPNTRWAAAARERLAELSRVGTPKDPAPPTKEELAKLIAQLAQASWRERQEASRRLAELGEAARTALDAAAQAPDPEVAWRARRLLERLDAAKPTTTTRATVAPRDARLLIELPGETLRPRQQPRDASDLDALVRALAGADASEVARARELLVSLGADALPHLIRALAAADETTAVEIMDILRELTGEALGFDPARWQTWWRARQQSGRD